MTPEVERLRGKIEGATLDEQITRIDELIAERDAALAEVERLRHVYADIEGYDQIAEEDKATISAWRACADQLAAVMGFHPFNPQKIEALAEYERLKTLNNQPPSSTLTNNLEHGDR